MNILISIGTLGLGGAEKQAIWLSNALAKDFPVTLLTGHGGVRESEISSQVSWIRLNPNVLIEDKVQNTLLTNNVFEESKPLPKVKLKQKVRIKLAVNVKKPKHIFQAFKFFLTVHRSITKAKPDFVITFLFHDTVIVGLATILRITRPALIVGRRSPIGYGGESRSFSQNLLLRFIYKRAKYAVLNSQSNYISAIKDGLESSKIVKINNRVENNINKYFSNSSQSLNLLCVANFFDYKNHFNLVHAISKITSDVKITFLGEGPLKPEIMQLAKNLGIQSQFYNHQEQMSVPKFDIDFIIIPSFTEGSSNALIEGLAAGFPCISTNVGSIPELLKMSAPIIVAEEPSIEHLVQAIETAIRERNKLKSTAVKFKKTIQNEFGEIKIIKEWKALLEH
jgi:glycosyltransferase involved in cell wall biosynthesis